MQVPCMNVPPLSLDTLYSVHILNSHQLQVTIAHMYMGSRSGFHTSWYIYEVYNIWAAAKNGMFYAFYPCHVRSSCSRLLLMRKLESGLVQSSKRKTRSHPFSFFYRSLIEGEGALSVPLSLERAKAASATMRSLSPTTPNLMMNWLKQWAF